MTEVRDWQKDMKLCKEARKGEWKWVEGKDLEELGYIKNEDGEVVCWFGDCTMHCPTSGEEPEDNDIKFMVESRSALPYWLQQYAAEKERADKAEEREQKLKEVIKETISNLGGDPAYVVDPIVNRLQNLLYTLYPLDKEEDK